MQNIKQTLSSKADTQFVKEKHKKLKKRALNLIEDEKKALENSIQEGDLKVSNQITDFEDKVSNLSKNTLWKIQDLEEIIKRRITIEYVNDSCKALEEKLKRELANQNSFDKEKLEKSCLELQSKLAIIENKLQEKLNANKQSLKEVQDRMDKSLVTTPAHEELQKYCKTNISELSRKLKELEKSANQGVLIDKFNNRQKSIEDKLQLLEEEL